MSVASGPPLWVLCRETGSDREAVARHRMRSVDNHPQCSQRAAEAGLPCVCSACRSRGALSGALWVPSLVPVSRAFVATSAPLGPAPSSTAPVLCPLMPETPPARLPWQGVSSAQHLPEHPCFPTSHLAAGLARRAAPPPRQHKSAVFWPRTGAWQAPGALLLGHFHGIPAAALLLLGLHGEQSRASLGNGTVAHGTQEVPTVGRSPCTHPACPAAAPAWGFSSASRDLALAVPSTSLLGLSLGVTQVLALLSPNQREP